MNLEIKTLNCVRRPLKSGDWILLWGIVTVMAFMSCYTGVFWYVFLFVPMVASLVWVCRPRNLFFRITHGFLLGFFWFVSMIGLGQWVKYYLIEIYKVPTNSMEQTIIPGDRVLVCKWVYGSRQFTGEGSERLRGFRGMKRDDIVVFNAPEAGVPIQKGTPYVKRCVALPGDMVEVRETELWVNGAKKEGPLRAVFRYRFFFRDSIAMQKAAEVLFGGGVNAPGIPILRAVTAKLFPSRNMLETFLTLGEAKFLSTLPGCTDFQLSYSRKPNAAVYPHHDSLSWNLNRWGPMWVPRRGDSIALTEDVIRLYAPLIEQHEGHGVTWMDSTAYVDGVPQRFYVFAKDYYFMMGDHRMESQDSRILGPIPEDHIIGKATHIMWSLPVEKPRKFRWNRIFKRLANN